MGSGKRPWERKTHLLLPLRERLPVPRDLGAHIPHRASEAAVRPPLLDVERISGSRPPGQALVGDLAVGLALDALAGEAGAGPVGVVDLLGRVGLDPELVLLYVGDAVGIRPDLEALFCLGFWLAENIP